jgi:hypothetical protein
MLDDWRDRRMERLEGDLTALRGDMWALEADVRRRFWERDQRRLQLISWLVIGLMWIAVGVTIATAAIKG